MNLRSLPCLLAALSLLGAPRLPAQTPQTAQRVAPGTFSNRPKLLWKFKTKGAVNSSALIANNRVYIGSNDYRLYALNFKTGKKLWEYKTKGIIESRPALHQGLLYFGSEDGNLYALDANTGKLRWKFQTDDKVMGGANVIPDPSGKGFRVVFGSYDSNVYCLNAATGKKIWNYTTDNYINGTPAVGNGKVILGGCDGALHIVRLTDGKRINIVKLESYVPGSVTLDGAFAYLGYYGNEVLCVNTDTAEIVWHYRDRQFPYFSTPAVAPDRIVIGGRDKQIHCISRTDGRGLWKYRTRGKVDSSPVICGGKAIIGSEDGRLYLIDLISGKEVYSYVVGSPIIGSPIIADGALIVGAGDGYVYALGGN